MLSFGHVGYRYEAHLLPVDHDLQVEVDYDYYYAHYHRFGRGEEQLAS
jgi:hypothetical protein